MISTLVIFIAVFSLLVFVHELGHFLAAKKAGVKVEEFGFGFPPRLFGIRKGDTIYSINWIPLGGFVKIKGESGEHQRDHDSFSAKKLRSRAAILLAGVGMNLILAWVLLSFGYVIGLPQVLDGLPAYARVRDARVQVVSALKGSPAAEAGVLAGDFVISVDGAPVAEVDDFRNYTSGKQGQDITVRLLRKKEILDKTVTPIVLPETGRPAVGLALVKTGLVSYPAYLAPVEGARAVSAFVVEIAASLYGLVRNVFLARKVAVDFTGPVGIAILTSEAVKMGFRYLLQFAALLSINLAVINVLPIPALDGGRLLFLAIERVRGRSVGRGLEALAHNVGFVLLMLLVVFVTYRDMVRFGDKIWKAATGLF